MKRTTKIAALMLTIAGPAYAERPSGWQTMGCDDPTQFRAVRSADTGAVLYWNNPTCSDPFSGGHEVPATQTPTRTAGGNVTENRGQNNGASGPEQGTGPDTGGRGNASANNGRGRGNASANNGRGRGNASANNGRGGNYDRTGQTDNGRGNGRNR